MNCGYTLVFLMMISLYSDSPPWQRLSTRYFNFFFSEEDRAIASSLARDADTCAEEIISYLGVPPPTVIEVRIAPRGEFRTVQPYHHDFPEWITGVAYHTLSLIVLRSPREEKGRGYDLHTTFVHEVSHVLLGLAFGSDKHIPRWLNEGVAMYLSREWDFTRVTTVTRAVLTDSLIPLSQLAYHFPEEKKAMELAYDESFYLISFLITKYGKEKFHQFITCYSEEKVLEEVVRKVYGVSLLRLEKEWHRYLSLRFSWIPLITSTSTLWFLITLIFLIGYIRKKRSAAVTLHQWEKEEH